MRNCNGEHKVAIKKNYSDAKIPTRGSEQAAGYDLYAYISDGQVEIKPGTHVSIDTGISFTAPAGYFGAVFARSGMAFKQGLRPCNCVGVIDSDYTGPVMVGLYNDSDDVKVVHHGDRIAQLIFLPYSVANFVEVENLEETKRADGGFGSTGTN